MLSRLLCFVLYRRRYLIEPIPMTYFELIDQYSTLNNTNLLIHFHKSLRFDETSEKNDMSWEGRLFYTNKKFGDSLGEKQLFEKFVFLVVKL